MKKRSLVVLMLTVALCAGTFATAFAAGAQFDGGKYVVTGPYGTKLESVDRAEGEAIPNEGKTAPAKGDSQEVQVEKVAKQFAKEVLEGKYNVTDTAELQGWVENNEDMVVVDTMGDVMGSYAAAHVKGAIGTSAPLYGKGWGESDPTIGGANIMTKDAFLESVATAVGTKDVTKKVTKKTYHYWNSKTKKWSTKKPAAKYYTKCTVKKSKYYGKKYYITKKTSKVTTQVVNKDKKVVVYCGFVGCGRSHEGAKLLVENGYKNVYRYGGGISAWIDAKAPIEGDKVTD